MVEHRCTICNLKFNKKSRLIEHMNKKNNCLQINDHDKNELNQLTNAPKSSEKLTNAPKSSEKLTNTLENSGKVININLENIVNKSHENELYCKYCNKFFSKNSNLTRHLKNYCRVIKQQDEEKEYIFKKLLLQETLLKEKDAEIHKLIFQNDILYNKICILEEKVEKISSKKSKILKKTTNISNNNTTNNISNTNNGLIVQLVNYGKENLEKINLNYFMNNIVKNNKVCGVKIPEEILKLIHFNPEYPELNNIYISDINREKCIVFKISNETKVI